MKATTRIEVNPTSSIEKSDDVGENEYKKEYSYLVGICHSCKMATVRGVLRTQKTYNRLERLQLRCFRGGCNPKYTSLANSQVKGGYRNVLRDALTGEVFYRTKTDAERAAASFNTAQLTLGDF